MTKTTTILGVTYEGIPMFGSLARLLYFYELEGKADKARSLLDSHNKIADVFGGPRVDLARQMTNLPDECLVTRRAVGR